MSFFKVQNVLLLGVIGFYLYLIVEQKHDKLKELIKPIVVFSMSIFFLINVRSNLNAQSILISVGLFLSSVGDYFLIEDKNLIQGIASFALAHFCFMGSFLGDIFSSNKQDKKGTGFVYQVLACAIYLITYKSFSFLSGFIPTEFFVPVAVYSLILSTMVALALFRHNKVGSGAFFLSTFGALLFAVSDSVLSFSLFMPGVKGVKSEFVVMLTYYLAELFIFDGAVVHFSNKKKAATSKGEKQN